LQHNINIMKNLTCLLVAVCYTAAVNAQGTVISPGTKVTTNGTVRLVLGAGNVVNNGTLGGTTGTLVFAGAVNFSGSGSTLVQNFIVAHTSGVSTLNAPIGVTNNAMLMFGNLDFKNDNLVIRSDLSTTANLMINGTPTGSVQGLVARASLASGPCPSYTSVLSVNIAGPAIRYQWQSSADSLTWADINGATSHDYTATISGSIYYRCHITATSGNFDEMAPLGKIGLDTPVATISGIDTLLVGNTSTLTGATAGGTWSSSNTAVLTINASTGLMTGISSGIATVTYTASNGSGCTGRSNLVIKVGTGTIVRPVVTVTSPAAVCAPLTVNLTNAAVTAGSPAGLSYTYFTDASATTVLASPDKVAVSGTYYIVGTDNSNVASVPMPVVVTVIVIQNLKAAFTFDSYCINNAVQFTNTSTTSGPVSYQWSDNTGKTSTATSPSFTFTATGASNMKLKVTSVSCPLISDSVTNILAIEAPIAGVRMPLVNLGMGEPTEVRARVFAGATYLWTPATGISNTLVFNPKIAAPAEQDYRITIKAVSGCITVDSILVRIFDKRIYVPNVFTPNGDGINDKLFVTVIGTSIRSLTYFRVYNRYSKLVFETTDATIGWDGKVNGVLQPMDTFVWVAEAKDASGNAVIRRGNVTLLR
jgi:gliding motility-associated-like protein